MHAGCIQIQRALDPPPTGLGHAAPVLVALRDQPPGRHGDDGLVEVAHLDRVQGDIDHVAVGTRTGHGDPVAHPQHVVGGQLHAGDETQDGVLEDQDQHRRHRAQARQQQADAACR